jgi:hypothetical protein
MGGRGANNAKHSDRRTGEVIGHRDGRVGEQTRCLLGRSATQARKDSVQPSKCPIESISDLL